MGVLIALVVIVVILVAASNHNSTKRNTTPSTPQTIRCPNCGSPAEVHGSTWECGWCGDFGRIRYTP